ncbi:unnamed protein product [Ectocarpus sp. 4 AP-2014]
MQPLIDEGVPPRVEAPSPTPAADAAASAAAATAAAAVSLPSAFHMHGAGLTLSGTNPPFVGSTVFEDLPTSQTSDTRHGSGSGSSSSAAFLDLHGATTPLSELPASSEYLGPHDGVLLSPTLAGRKRSKPTGGWSSSNDGNDQERATAGADTSSTCMRRIQDHDHSEARPSRFIIQGAAAAAAAAGVVRGKGEVGDDFLAAGGGSSSTTTSGASTAEEMELDVGDTPVAFPQAATNQQLGGDATRSTSSEAPAATFIAEPSTAGPAVVVPAATTETTAAAAAAAAVFVPGVAATADAVDGSAADPVSFLGDYNFSFEELNKMSKRYPTVNTLANQTPMPLLGWLTRELDMNHYDMRCLILRHPRLMAYRVTSHVAPKTKWLRERLGLGQAALRKLVTTYPAVLSRSVEKNLEPKFKWLEERLGASQEEVAVLIKRFPLIFGYSTTQNLEPTVLFFMVDLSGELEEIKSAIMSCPSILSRSLDKRMLPRAQQMREKDIEPRFGLHKWVVSTYTDKQFTRWLEGRGT